MTSIHSREYLFAFLSIRLSVEIEFFVVELNVQQSTVRTKRI